MISLLAPCFNPRTRKGYDIILRHDWISFYWFQSTYLYKVRQASIGSWWHSGGFQSTYLYKVRQKPRSFFIFPIVFQSTYLYKVRRHHLQFRHYLLEFQSTYLYKVRLLCCHMNCQPINVSIHVPI